MSLAVREALAFLVILLVWCGVTAFTYWLVFLYRK